ncbi:MAG: bifunctional adenosylcobinamide kinase/adenosylcobinamide-phosphate guanylyltransferase [Lachnospiraceae bacterium]|nr:bifunctional adenosylcobinamide kinase/adenosylcobinamide-phosphate guanylyltransferase [Lachnospiraceae bacterium]
MIILVCGGASCGKSEYAERLALDLSGAGERTYLATMESDSEAAKKRIADHERRRAGKGFDLCEQRTDIGLLAGKTSPTVLLECLSTLVANEMFDNGFCPDVSDKVFADIKQLADSCENIIIVSNDVFSDGCLYEEMTEDYIRNLGELMQMIAQIADAVYEMRCGLSVCIKGGSGV